MCNLDGQFAARILVLRTTRNLNEAVLYSQFRPPYVRLRFKSTGVSIENHTRQTTSPEGSGLANVVTAIFYRRLCTPGCQNTKHSYHSELSRYE